MNDPKVARCPQCSAPWNGEDQCAYCGSWFRMPPLRMLVPDLPPGMPLSSINLAVWRGRMEAEVRKWLSDPNYISIQPLGAKFITLGEGSRSV